MTKKSFLKNIALSTALIAGIGLGSPSCAPNNNVSGDSATKDTISKDSGISKDNTSETSVPNKIDLEGSVQKGPFIQGSDVQIYLLDKDGNNLGSIYNTQTSDNVGNFSTTLAGLPQSYTGNLSLSGNGFFFKEAAGKLSDAQQTLKALYGAGNSTGDGSVGNPEVHLNLITHLSYLRAKNLLKKNSDLNQSVKQAQNELTASLKSAGLVYPTGANGLGTSMDLFGNNTEVNNYLLAVSCAFEKAVKSSDSALQELLNKYQADLADDGKVDSKLVDKVKTGITDQDPTVCITNLKELGKKSGETFNLDLAGVNKVLDSDLDGKVNFEDLDIDGDGVVNDKDPRPYDSKIKKTVDSNSTYCKDTPYWGILCWEKNPSTKMMTLTEATDYCKNLDDLNSSWRVPKLKELLILIEGCSDFSLTYQTPGYCTSSCNSLKGPGKNGCYWNSSLEGTCGSYHADIGKADFTKATCPPSKAETPDLVRCVRNKK